MPLSLELLEATHPPVDLAGITPDVLRQRTRTEIEKLQLPHGAQRTALAELFRVSGDASDGVMHLDGDLRGADAIGGRMAGGTMYVHGSAGMHIGAEMTGGEIHLEGNAGDWVGAEMRGGRIHIHGDAGDFAGAARPGSRMGMTGGEILVEGNAGDAVGTAMRRGLIAVAGAAGDLAGCRLLAGTILVFGRCGARPGLGMRRGALGLFGTPATSLPPTFRYACRLRSVVATMLLTHLQTLRFRLDPADFAVSRFDWYSGDFLLGGRGEILLPAGD